MRIVIVQRRFHPNTLGWVQGFRELGHEVRLVLHTPPNPRDPVIDVPIARALPSQRLTGLAQRITRSRSRRDVWIPDLGVLWHELARSRTDLVLLKQVRFASVVVSVVALLRGARRIAWTNDRARLDRWHWRLARWLGLLPRRLVWTSTPDAGSLTTGQRCRTGRFVPYAVNVTGGESPPNAHDAADPDGPIRVLTVGKFGAARKRPWWTLEAADRAGLLDGRARFTFVGAGRPTDVGVRRIEDIARTAGRPDLVTIERDVPHARMRDVYRAHDLLVLPSRDEPFGMVVLEAMAHGLAIVVSDTVGAKCCVVPGVNGQVFDSDSVEDLADKLARMLNDRRRLADMGAASLELVSAHATPRRCAEAILQLAVR